MATHTRYERLNSSQSDFKRYSTSMDNDDDIEEIELGIGTEHRLRYEDTKENSSATIGVGGHHSVQRDDVDLDDLYANGHVMGVNTLETGVPDTGGHNNTEHVPGSRFMHMAIGTLATILLYLTLSITLTFYQKELIHKIKFPLTIVSYHLVMKYTLAAIWRSIYKCRSGKTRVQLDWCTSLRKMAPTGIASGIDIGFSNLGLELVSISLYTMGKSSTIVFILFFAILLGLEKKSLSLVFIVGLIACGLLMFTYKSTQFNALGFVFILIASLSSGVRWSFAQFVMQKSKLGMHNPIDMIYHMQPWMMASLMPFCICIEGQRLYDILRDLSDTSSETIYTTMFSVTLGAVLAFLMEISEFLVLSQTSSLTLSIAGIFKDICQVTLAVVINKDNLTLINILGLVVLLGGICCHVIHKYTMLMRQASNLALDDRQQYNETSINANAGGNSSALGHGGSSGPTGALLSTDKKYSSLTVPLLEQSDSEESTDGDGQNASDVIFDVLKRRDMQR